MASDVESALSGIGVTATCTGGPLSLTEPITVDFVTAPHDSTFYLTSVYGDSIGPNGATSAVMVSCCEYITGNNVDSYITQCAESIAAYWPSAIIRLAWEFNGSWFPWGVGGLDPDGTDTTLQEAWIAVFQHFVNLFRAVSENFRFLWGITRDTGSLGINPENYWPGESYVDIVGNDIYNTDVTGGTWQGQPTEWQNMLTETYGLNWLAAFATTYSKEIAIPEWACTPESTTSPGDDPFFTTNMCAWCIAQVAAGFVMYCMPWNNGLDAWSNFPDSETTLEDAGLADPVPAPINIGSGASGVIVPYEVIGLVPSTTYHFQTLATSSGGTTTGSDTTFETFALGGTYAESYITSNVSVSASTPTNITSVSLTQGTWVVTARACLHLTTAVLGQADFFIGPTGASTSLAYAATSVSLGGVAGGVETATVSITKILVVSGTTTVYFECYATEAITVRYDSFQENIVNASGITAYRIA
jgi:hypothetical protein